mmetsp:Transcript_32944/g.97235  ORF Transcript_32944/g.97235 Transcript_32944/m.97235 type:complete len:414 (-) Transcript_32944:170-1411(-)
MRITLLLLITVLQAQAFSVPSPQGIPVSRRTHGGVSLLRIAAHADDDGKGDNDAMSFTARGRRRGKLKDVREGSLMAATLETGRVPYGEQSRKFRRTVFSHGDWVEHRSSSSHIITNLRSMLISGVVRQLRSQVLIVTSAAAFILGWNLIAVPSLGSLPFVSPIMLPPIPFTLSSPALGLLLVFRTNASYARWGEARTTWARMVAHGRNLIRMAGVFSDDKVAVQSLGKAVWLYCRTVMNQLSSPEEDEPLYQDEVLSTYGEKSGLARRILSSPDRTLAAWKQLSLELHGLPAVADPKALIETDKSIIILGECAATMEKIYSSPVPLVYTRHTARFLSLWALLLPAALYSSFVDIGQAWAIIPASGILAFFLFGVDALSFQLEEPFSILPMKSFCDQILGSVDILAGVGGGEA